MQRAVWRSVRWIPTLMIGACLACADATPAEDSAAAENPCPDGYTVDADGECSIPGIGQGDLETPDAPFEEPTIDNSDIEAARGYFLNQEGDGKFFVYVDESKPVGIRAITQAGQPAVGLRIQFEVIEVSQARPSGVTLSARSAETNEFGVAHVTVTGGPEPAFFKLRMSADQTVGLTYDVNVLQPPDLDRPVMSTDPPPDGMLGGCTLDPRGRYALANAYEPARLLGDGLADTLESIHGILSDPGGFVGDLIRDRIGGIWGAVIRSAVRPVVNYLYDYVVQNYAPDWARWMLTIVEDIASILVELEIQGTLEFGTLDPATCEMQGVHRWEKLVLLWRAGCAAGDDQCGRFEIPLNQLGISTSETQFTARVTQNLGPVATVEIDPHQLQMNLGVAVIWFIQNVILPNRLNVNSFGDLLQQVLPCEAVGDLAAQYVGNSIVGFAVAPFVEDACEAAMEAAGNALVGMLRDQLVLDTFQLAGTCKLRDTDGDVRADRVEDGRWNDGLEGDFSGERVP